MILKFGFNQRAIDIIKTYPGRRWNGRYWSVPHEHAWNCLVRLKPILTKSEHYAAWQDFQREDEFRKESRRLSSAVSSGIDVPAPEGLSLYDFQKVAVEYMLMRNGTLVAEECGMGKTAMTMGFINSKPDILDILILAPLSLLRMWQHEIQRWSTRSHVISIFKKELIPKQTGKVIFNVINYDKLSKIDPEIIPRDYHLIVLDEAHFIQSGKRKPDRHGNWEFTTKRVKYAQRLMNHTKYKLLLTGTPLTGKPKTLWSLLYALDSERWSSFTEYAERYCDAHEQQINWYGDTALNVEGSSNLDELQEILRSTIMVRHNKQDCLKDLPSITRQTIVLPKIQKIINMEKKALKDYLKKNQMNEKEFQSRIQSLTRLTPAFNFMSKVRHEVGRAKLNVGLEFIETLLSSVQKLVVFVHHRDIAMTLMENLSEYNPVHIIGGMDEKERYENQQKFQNDSDCRVFIGNLTAAGVGIDLQASHTAIFLEQDWAPATIEQCTSRIYRNLQTEPVNIYHLVLDGSLDKRITEVLIEKQQNMNEVLD